MFKYCRKSANSDESSSEESESSDDESTSAEEDRKPVVAVNHVAAAANAPKKSNTSETIEKKSNLDLLLEFCENDSSAAPVLTPSLGKLICK